MAVRLNPYISFRDTAGPAMEFYRSVFGGELTSTSIGDIEMPGIGPEESGKVMHSMLDIGDGLTLMAADMPAMMEVRSNNHPIALFGDDETLLRGWWDGLADGGTVAMPLEMAPWGDTFGQLTDKFGVSWLVNITGPTD